MPIVRIMPMFQSDGAQLVPSLTLEALRVAQGASTYIIESTAEAPVSIVAVKVGDFEVPTTRYGWLVALSHPGTAGPLCLGQQGAQGTA